VLGRANFFLSRINWQNDFYRIKLAFKPTTVWFCCFSVFTLAKNRPFLVRATLPTRIFCKKVFGTPGFQQIALVDTETGEFGERRLTHREEAEQFYNTLKERSVRVGMEASGHARWFERLLRELQFELWHGIAALKT
jgi:hypothetical protein